MQSGGETSILVILVIVILVWGYHLFRRWMYAPPKVPFFINGEFQEDDVCEWLRSEGYTIVGGKTKIPITIYVDDEKLPSRYFIDYYVKHRDDDRLYAVKLARSRQPVEWTGTGVRDRLLPYLLLHGGALGGILYVDAEARTIRKITYEPPDPMKSPSDQQKGR